MYWYHPGNVYGGDVGSFLTLYLYFFLRKKESISIGICEEFLARKRKGVAANRIINAIFMSLTVIVSVVIVFFGERIVSGSHKDEIYLYLFLILFSIPWIFWACRLAVKAWLLDLIHIVWIEDEYIFIKGVNQEYISEFPEWSDYSDFTLPYRVKYDFDSVVTIVLGIAFLIWILIAKSK